MIDRILMRRPANPIEAPTPAQWKSCEAILGIEIPADFKSIVTVFGSGCFGRGLHLKNPAAASPYIRLDAASLAAFRENASYLESQAAEKLYPHAGGLILIGGIDRQLFFYRPDARKKAELLYIDSDMFSTHAVIGGISGLIEALYSKELFEPWAQELHEYISPDNTVPFFTPGKYKGEMRSGMSVYTS